MIENLNDGRSLRDFYPEAADAVAYHEEVTRETTWEMGREIARRYGVAYVVKNMREAMAEVIDGGLYPAYGVATNETRLRRVYSQMASLDFLNYVKAKLGAA